MRTFIAIDQNQLTASAPISIHAMTYSLSLEADFHYKEITYFKAKFFVCLFVFFFFFCSESSKSGAVFVDTNQKNSKIAMIGG